MAKIFPATCEGGVVKLADIIVPDVEILSAGVGSSMGVLILSDERKFYLPEAFSDLETTLQDLSSALADISSALKTAATTFTAIGAGMTGPTTAPPPTLATSVAQINAKATHLDSIKTDIDNLIGDLK